MRSKWIVLVLPYFAVWAGLFILKSAWLALIGFHLAILLTLLWLRQALPLGVFFKPVSWMRVLPGVFLCAASGLGLYLLWDLFGVVPDLPARLQALGLTDSTWAGFITYFSIINPFFEEYFWRCLLGSETSGFYWGDAAYAAYHIMIVWDKAHPLSVAFIFFVLVFIGWFWRQLYRRDASLLAPLLGHMIADLSILLAVFRMAG